MPTTTTTVQVTLAQFDDHAGAMAFDVIRDGVPVRDFPPVLTSDYQPRGNTPLRDATASMIGLLDEQVAAGTVTIGVLLDRSGSMARNRDSVIVGVNEFIDGMREVEADPDAAGKVLCVIVTDGKENASKEMQADALRAMIGQREAAGWTFIYLGANQDAWSEGRTAGLSGTASGQTVNFASTPKGTSAAFGEVSRRAVNYLGDQKTFEGVYAGAAAMSTIAEDGEVTSSDGTSMGSAERAAQLKAIADAAAARAAQDAKPYGDVQEALRQAKGSTS